MWCETGSAALMIHLGMSGQLRRISADADLSPHTRLLIDLEQIPYQLRFIDQRIFGALWSEGLAETSSPAAHMVPASISHIAADPFDPEFSLEQTVAAYRRRRIGVKQALLDQSIMSGVGNIYADESLWRVKQNFATRCCDMSYGQWVKLIDAVRQVMGEAIEQGGTSFDSLYVNVNGSSGYFGVDLAVYGRHGKPCHRCHTVITRVRFAGRSSHYCPQCQVC